MASSGLNTLLLTEAVRDGTQDVIDVARDVGASAARLGVPLHEVLDHVEKAYAPDAPSFAVIRSAAVAWAELAMIHHVDIACENPLTSLATVPHLRSRLAEVYRGAQRLDECTGDVKALVVLEFPRSPVTHELELSLRALEVADVLRLVFTGEETFTQLTRRRFTVLVNREDANETTMRLLALLLDRTLASHGQARLWIEHLPASEDGIAQVLVSLCE